MTDRREFRDLTDPDEAERIVANLPIAPSTEHVPLSEARGRVLAERIDAEIDVPGFDRSGLDGYALRARDTFGADEANPARLTLVGEVHAGAEPGVDVGDGEAVEISTGAVLPPGADAMVPVERTDEADGDVLVRTAVAPGDNVTFAGADVAAGERAIGPGTTLTPREIGLLSALGIDEVPVRGRPTVGIVSTGDELVRPGGDLAHERGQIYDVNSYTLAAAVEDAGGEPTVYPHAGDDESEMERLLYEAAAECDLVLTSGSTSASAVDVVYRVIESEGELLLHGISLKPGKPTLVGTIGGAAYVGLPGYPVSAAMVFRTLVAPSIRNAAGRRDPEGSTLSGAMIVEERFEEGRRRLLPVGLVDPGPDAEEDGPLVYPVDKGSGATTSLTEADGLVTVPADTAYVGAGERVDVELFSEGVRPPTVLGVGEDDPALSRLLDRLERPRYLSVGTREGVRRLRAGIPDVVVTAGPLRRDIDAEEIAGWNRDWGLVVPEGNPDGIEGVADLADRELRMINRTTDSGLRASLDDALEALADDRGIERRDLETSIDGYGLAVRAHESPARKVRDGRADAGLGLRATADALDFGFVSLGTQHVRLFVASDRAGKLGVEELRIARSEFDGVLSELPGYDSTTGH